MLGTKLNNHLIDCFHKCIELTGCFDKTMEVLQKVCKRYPEVATLIANILFLSNQELEAVKFIHDMLSHSNSVAEIPGAAFR